MKQFQIKFLDKDEKVIYFADAEVPGYRSAFAAGKLGHETAGGKMADVVEVRIKRVEA